MTTLEALTEHVLNSTGNVTDLSDVFREFDMYTAQFNAFTITLMLMYIPIFFLAFIGNILIALIVGSNRQLRNSTNLYLCNMALADLCVSLICVPMAVGQALYKVWIYGEIMCKVTVYLQVYDLIQLRLELTNFYAQIEKYLKTFEESSASGALNIGTTVAASIYTIAILSIDRFLAIRHPIVFRRVSNTKVATKLIIAVWLVSMCVMSPLLLMRKVDVVNIIPGEPFYLCNEHWPDDSHRQAYDLVLFFIAYIVPGIVICCCYGLIGKELWREDKNLNRTESETSRGIGKHVMNGRKRVAKMLVALAILFAVCWLPFYIINLRLDFSTLNAESFVTALPFAILLGHANSALNPILYFYSSKSFRKYLFRTLKCKKRGNKRNFAVRYNPPKARIELQAENRPRIRVISSSTLTRTRSTGDSFRFSRSSNTSFKSTNTTRSRDSSSKEKKSFLKVENRDKNYVKVDKKFLDLNISDKKSKDGYETIKALVYAHKREILDRTLSIPTTINEESSRLGSVSPMRPPIHSPLITQIPEMPEN